MKKNVLFIAVLFSLLTKVYSQMSPVISSWQLNTTGAIGYGNFTTNVKEVLYSSTSVYIKTNDVPDYMPANAGPFPGIDWWPNNPWFPDSMGYTFRIRMNPTQNLGAPRKPPYGHIGIWRNGVSVYNPLDAKSYNNDTTWFQNAYYWEHLIGETFDSCWGHPNQSHEYHTHQSPACVYDETDSTHHSPIIGYAFDGFPIYGAYAYGNTNGTGAIRRMTSSYPLRNITDRTVLPNGTVLAAAFYGPAISSIPLGAYQEDYEYVSGSGDLDFHNGRFCITPEYPTGTYAYFVTIDATLTPVYPYAIGQTYYGVVIPSDGNLGPNSGFVNITETVTTYSPSLTAITDVEIITNMEVYPNPAADQLNFKISTNDFTTVYKGEIYNQVGELIISGDVKPNRNNTYITSELAAGIYFLKIFSDKKTYTSKFVVAR